MKVYLSPSVKWNVEFSAKPQSPILESGHFKHDAENTMLLHFQLVAMIEKKLQQIGDQVRLLISPDLGLSKTTRWWEIQNLDFPYDICSSTPHYQFKKGKIVFVSIGTEIQVYLAQDTNTHNEHANSLLVQCNITHHTKWSIYKVT